MITKKHIMKLLYKQYSKHIPKFQICNAVDTMLCSKCPYNAYNHTAAATTSYRCIDTMTNDYITYIKLQAWKNLTC